MSRREVSQSEVKKDRMRRKNKILAMLLCIALLATMLLGCGSEDGMGIGSGTNNGGMGITAEGSNAEGSNTKADQSEENAPTTYVPLASGSMGRYVEESLMKMDKEIMQNISVMKQTGEGIWLFGAKEAKFRKNGSETFETVEYPDIIRDSYIDIAAASDNGDMAFVCYEKNEEGIYEFILRAVLADGTVIEMDRGASMCVSDMVFGPDGNLYLNRFGDAIGLFRYELGEGEGENLCFSSSVTENLTFVGNRLLATDEGTVWIYNIETDTQEEQDTVLDDFFKENITGMGGYGSGVYMAALFPSQEEDVVYIACEKGIFRHVLYGSVIEQVVNGELNYLSDPSRLISGAASWQDENGNVAFLVAYVVDELVNYVYDETIPTVPEQMLRVYSLEDNSDLRQIITLFQQLHPECYVKYEVGLHGAGAARVDDKIKKLNTAMLSGNGPDVLITDGLDESNYSSKGLLLDLTSLVDGITGEDALLPNFVKALKKEGEIYSVPAAFYIPMIAGEEKLIKKVDDLESLTKAVEDGRKKNPERIIMTSSLPECILTVLAQSESDKWVKKGELDEKALKEFLNCAYRVYEAELAGVTTDVTELEQKYLDEAASYVSSRPVTRMQQLYYDFNVTMVDLMLQNRKAAIGYVKGPFDLCWIDQLPEDYGYAPLEDEEGVGFKPVMKFAINSTSEEQKLAEEFIKLALSPKTADLSLNDGMPLNVTALEKRLEKRAGGADFSYHMGGVNDYGEEVELSAVWPSEEILEQYRDAIGKVNHVIKEETYLMEQVVEIGAKAMQEGKTVDWAVQEIKRKTALYLAE